MAVGNPGRMRLSISERFLQAPEGRLYTAAKEGDLAALHAACEEGAALDTLHPEFGSPPLIIASLHGHTDCVHYLLEEHADIEIRNKFGWTALLAASSKGNLTLSGYLVARNADVRVKDKLGRTPLHNAVAAGCDDLAKGLLDERADPSAKTNDGKTVLSVELGRPKRQSKELEDRLTQAMGLPFPKGHVKDMLGNQDPSFALLFPGQGCQRQGMLGWAEDHDRAWPLIQQASDVLGYDIFEVTELNIDGRLDHIDVGQVALFVAAMCGLEWFRDQEGKHSCQAAAAAGMSCGELAALCTAGCFDFADGVRLVQTRGKALAAAADVESEPQKMLSVVGCREDDVEAACEAALSETGGLCKVANRLFPDGFALSGTVKAIDAVRESLREAGASKVSELKGCAAAFHTELMRPAEEPLRQHLEAMLREGRFRSPQITVYSSQTGERWLPGTPPDMVAAGLIRGLTAENQWEDTCRAMIDDGVELLWEIGPMKQLRAMMRHIDYTQWKNMKCIDC